MVVQNSEIYPIRQSIVRLLLFRRKQFCSDNINNGVDKGRCSLQTCHLKLYIHSKIALFCLINLNFVLVLFVSLFSEDSFKEIPAYANVIEKCFI